METIIWITCHHIKRDDRNEPEFPPTYEVFDIDPPGVEEHHIIMLCGLCSDVIYSDILNGILAAATKKAIKEYLKESQHDRSKTSAR